MFFALKKKITSFVKAFYFIFFKVHLLFWSHNILGDVRFNMGFLFTLQTHRKSFEKKKISFHLKLYSAVSWTAFHQQLEKEPHRSPTLAPLTFSSRAEGGRGNDAPLRWAFFSWHLGENILFPMDGFCFRVHTLAHTLEIQRCSTSFHHGPHHVHGHNCEFWTGIFLSMAQDTTNSPQISRKCV